MITKLYKGAVSQLVILSMVSMLPANDVSAQMRCEQPKCCEDECCDTAGAGFGGFFGGGKGALLGAAVLGAAAGAAAGAAVSSGKGKHGSRGARGERGLVGATGKAGSEGRPGMDGLGFTTDPESANTLKFNYALTAIAGLSGATIIPYVSAPDGTLTPGAAIGVAAGAAIPAIQPITLRDLEYGTYTAGILLSSGGIVTGATLLLTVDASRDASSTTIVAPSPFLAGLTPQSETNAAFVYGPEPVP